MLDRLTESFSGLVRKLAGKAALSEANIAEAMQDVRRSMIDADVNLDVVNKFCDEVIAEAVGKQVTKSLSPGQEIIGIVYERLVGLLGTMPALPEGASQDEIARTLLAEGPGIMQVSPGPTVVMLCGLQGSGKTTTAGKLAGFLKKRGRSVLLVAADLQRPAAVEQLQAVAQTAERDVAGGAQIHFYGELDKSAEYGKAVGVAVQVCQRGIAHARSKGIDTVILDTAGRLHVSDELMGELAQVRAMVRPHQIFLVVDAMTGQDAVRSAKGFHDKLGIDGLIMTKFDSDTRGGAALSVKTITGAPIRFIGTGEKLDAIEEFHAQRIAGRILGMGDIVSLVEKAKEQVSDEEAAQLEAKIAKGEMTLDDFLSQLRSLRRMGPLKQILGMLPGVGSMLKDVHIDDKHLNRVEGMIHSMTKQERRDPKVLNNSRRRRIAAGSATKQEEIGQLVRQFETVSSMSKQMANMSPLQKIKAVKEMGSRGGMGSMIPGMTGMPNFATKGSTHTAGLKAHFKKRKK